QRVAPGLRRKDHGASPHVLVLVGDEPSLELERLAVGEAAGGGIDGVEERLARERGDSVVVVVLVANAAEEVHRNGSGRRAVVLTHEKTDSAGEDAAHHASAARVHRFQRRRLLARSIESRLALGVGARRRLGTGAERGPVYGLLLAEPAPQLVRLE